MTSQGGQHIELTLRKSWIGTTPKQRENLKGLGLFRREKRVVRKDTPSIRGMIQKVLHLVTVRRLDGQRIHEMASHMSMGAAVHIEPPIERDSSKRDTKEATSISQPVRRTAPKTGKTSSRKKGGSKKNTKGKRTSQKAR